MRNAEAMNRALKPIGWTSFSSPVSSALFVAAFQREAAGTAVVETCGECTSLSVDITQQKAAIVAGFLGLSRHKQHERTGFELYGSAVTAARDPVLYTALGVPDTLDGRFDMIGLHAFLLIHRLTNEPEPGPALAQAVFDAMFSDMDVNLREMGVGDLSVGKKVKAMWEALHGRSAAYAAALRAGDRSALEAALRRNVWRGLQGPHGAASALARLVFAQHAFLADQPLTELGGGRVRFLPANEASR